MILVIFPVGVKIQWDIILGMVDSEYTVYFDDYEDDHQYYNYFVDDDA